ncbi:hypothetical protein AV656_06305 [Bhargavaea cecembensis]|uniref:Uncharacterized protein n=1 Tax=Bhargavaea cecembensis TaxID=394098 RepID=A0A165H1K1_9BACL|nr:hypothetical protein [Bhargavaea cecembensis]KZE38514.1 hypothetical protein AV656_06305 [Bhargavaea cecembensis]
MTALTVLPVVILILFLILAFRWRHPVAGGRTIIRLFLIFVSVLAVLAIAAQFVRPSAHTFPFVGENVADEIDRVYHQVMIEQDPDAVPENQILSKETFAFSGNELTVRSDETADEYFPIQLSIRTGPPGEATVTVFRPVMLVGGYDVSEALLQPETEILEARQTVTIGFPPQELNFRKIGEPDLPLFNDDGIYSTYHRLPIFLITVPEGVEVKTEGHVNSLGA